MGFTDTFRDFYESLTFSNELHAEAPEEDSKEEKSEGDADEKSDEGDSGSQDESKDEGGEEEGGEKEEDEKEEEEEEEDEPVDPKPQIEAECAKTAKCAPLKQHFEECSERVAKEQANPNHKGPREDCVEEFFHLQHCATQCAAPKLFRVLK